MKDTIYLDKKCENALNLRLRTSVTPLLEILIEAVVYILINLFILRKIVSAIICSQSVLKNKNHLMQTFFVILFF
jgi:hypothetical protein